MILLDKKQINFQLYEQANRFHIHLFKSIDSTNLYLQQLPYHKQIDICCAEMQTAGKGRLGRDWYSPFAENIYFSIRWPVTINTNSKKSTESACSDQGTEFFTMNQLGALSLIVSLAIKSTIDHFIPDADILIKWPNDLMWHEKKLAGILIELMKMSDQQMAVIIGIGLNVNSLTHQQPTQSALDRPWCSLLEITGMTFDRNQLIAQLILELNQYIEQFFIYGFNRFLPAWKKSDYLLEKQIKVCQPTRIIHGLAKGVNQLGQLILIDDNGKEHHVASGEASIQLFNPHQALAPHQHQILR